MEGENVLHHVKREGDCPGAGGYVQGNVQMPLVVFPPSGVLSSSLEWIRTVERQRAIYIL